MLKTWLNVLAVAALLYGVGRLTVLQLDCSYEGRRAPYLQIQSPHAMLLRWQTSQAVVGVVRYGKDPNHLTEELRDTDNETQHALLLDQLDQGTEYYYQIGCCHRAPNGPINHFKTVSPQQAATRLWVLGDPGKKGPDQSMVIDAAHGWMGANPGERGDLPDLVLTTGDNAYKSGSNQQFQDCFFTPFEAVFANTPVVPAHGNHDARRNVFFNIFDFPVDGAHGGFPSHNEGYFSFDYGNLHVIMLDTATQPITLRAPMVEWLKRDLKTNSRPWTIAVFHHPPYSDGGHQSDHPSGSDGAMTAARDILVPILENGGVDVVLNGHSHGYERSYPLREHHIQATQAGAKVNGAAELTHTTIYQIIGSSSKTDEGHYQHPLMAASYSALGSVIIDVDDTRLISRFIDNEGRERDRFQLQQQPLARSFAATDSELKAETEPAN